MFLRREFDKAYDLAFPEGGMERFLPTRAHGKPWADGPLRLEPVPSASDRPTAFLTDFGPVEAVFAVLETEGSVTRYIVGIPTPDIVEALKQGSVSAEEAVLSDLRFVVEMDGLLVTRYWNVTADDLIGLEPGSREDIGSPADGASLRKAHRQGVWKAMEAFLPKFRWVTHRVRQSAYEVVLPEVSVQASRPIAEGDILRVYVGDDGRAWAREAGEFEDGRFSET